MKTRTHWQHATTLIRNFIVSMVLVFFLHQQIHAESSNVPVAKKGVIDIGSWNFTSDGVLNLDGQWEFYWKKLLSPTDFTTQQYPDTFLTLPGYWPKNVIKGEVLDSYGYATYRLTLNARPSKQTAILHIKHVLSAFKVWVNDSLMFESGRVSDNAESSEAHYTTCFVPLRFDSAQQQIVIQISNYHHRKGGVSYSLELRAPQDSQVTRSVYAAIDLLFFGSFFIIGLYHLALFFLRRKVYSTLFFGLYALLIAFRMPLINEEVIYSIFPLFNWELSMKLEYFTFFAGVPMWMLFLYSVFNDIVKRWIIKVYVIVGIVFCATLVTPASFYSQLATPYQLISLFAVVYSLVVLIKANLRRLEGSTVLLIACIFLAVTVASDLLFYLGFFEYPSWLPLKELTPVGLFVFIFSQSYILAIRFSAAFNRNEELTEQLNYQNQNLEKLVEIRTTEIQQQNEEILAQRDALEEQNHKIEFQNEHIKSSIRYAQTIQHAILPSQQDINQYFKHFVIYRPKDIVSGDFYWMAPSHDKKYVFFAVVDCTGHGVPGAFMSMIGSRLLNLIIVEQYYYEPSDVLSRMNAEIRKTLNQEQTMNNDGMDLSLCRLEKNDNNTWTLLFAGAKNDLLHYKNSLSTIEEINADRRSIGGVSLRQREQPFATHQCTIEQNDTIYLMSDGLIDQQAPNRKRFGSVRLKNMLQEAGKLKVEEQKMLIEQRIAQYQENEEQRDDITIIGINF